MSLIPITIRRRLRDSGFSEEQTDALDEAVQASRDGLASEQQTQNQFEALRADIAALRREMKSEMKVMQWWLFGVLSGVILAATAAIIAAIAVWG